MNLFIEYCTNLLVSKGRLFDGNIFLYKTFVKLHKTEHNSELLYWDVP